jgi:ATP-binding protein involved in chromosome partitioning
MDDLENKIYAALKNIHHKGDDIVSRGMVTSLHITGKDVVFVLEVDPVDGALLEPLRQQAEAAVKAINGIGKVDAILSAQRTAQASSEPDPHGMNKNPRLHLPVKHIIAVGSGKGGVGKSTVAFNLAIAMAERGHKVALLDADIYGPSVPRLSGIAGQKPVTNDAGKLIPLQAHGLKLMSMGFLVEEEKAMIWRGPMVQTAFYQMLRDVDWTGGEGDLDVMIIDLPPGTGDVQLTLAQKISATGAVIVSTPQDLALIDARKAFSMFEKTDVRVLGIVENMSTYICTNCGHEEHIFGHGGAKAEAEKSGVPFLGEIPLSASIRRDADAGHKASHPSYGAIADKILAEISGS